MKYLRLFFLLLFISSCTKKEINQEFDPLKYSDLIGKIDSITKSSTDKIKYECIFLLEREIIKEYEEYVYIFSKATQDDKNEYISHVDSHVLKFIKNKDKIIYLEIFDSKGGYFSTNNENDISLYKIEEEELIDLKTKFESIYTTKLNFNDLFETRIRYGESCGYAGINPYQRAKLIEFIKEKDTTNILKWLKSANVEKQLYAIEGIYKLKNKGLKFKSKIDSLITIVENKKGLVNVCSGCEVWNDTITKRTKRIKEKFAIR